MTSRDEGWSALRRVVEEALDLPSAHRDAHLGARFADPAERARAARLLRACEQASSTPMFEEPAAEFAAPVLSDVEELERSVPEDLREALAGRYTIERELGRGGMATVFLARDERHGRSVALKLLRPRFLHDGDAARGIAWFQREIEIAARLSHPHIVPLYDSGAAAGLLYFISPFVDGETLRERLARAGRPALPDAVRLLRDVARALAYAHRQGLVHRDIKPANILLNQEGDALVADFGVAKGLVAAGGSGGGSDGGRPDSGHLHGGPDNGHPHGEHPDGRADDEHPDGRADGEHPDGRAGGEHPDDTRDQTHSSPLIIGTPAYMAPEQAAGDPGIDARADLYSLGVVAYELLTGAPPVAGRSGRGLLAARVSEEPEPVGALRPDVPAPLAALVDRLLARKPEDRPRDAAEVLEVLDAAVVAVSPDAQLGQRARARRGRRRFVGVGAGVAAAVGLWWALPASESPPTNEPSIAVLTFAAATNSLEESAFSEGLADGLVGALRRVPFVRVAARPSAAALAGRGLDTPAIGELLGVETLLQGSVRHDGDLLHVDASLVGAPDSRAIWSRSYRAPAGELFALQERIARDVATALASGNQAERLPDRLVTRGTEDPLAYELYQKGRLLWNTRQRDGLLRALTYFEQAIERDPGYARAYAGAADTWTFLALFGHAAPRDAYPRARAAAERAVELDGMLVDGHATLAHLLFVYDWNWSAAEVALERAIALDPRYPALRMYYASYLHSVGRPEEALAQLGVARELDPLTPTGVFGGRVLVDTRRPDEAIRVLLDEVELEPRLDLGHQLLAHAYLQKGMAEEAMAAMRRAAELSGPRDQAQLAYIHAKTGNTAEARRLLADLRESPHPLELLGFHLAMAYGALGESDEAFRWLEAAYAARGGYMNVLGVTAGFDSLRPDPRFDALLRRMGLR